MRSASKRKRFLFFVGNGVVETYALDEAAVTTVARVSYDYVEERAVF